MKNISITFLCIYLFLCIMLNAQDTSIKQWVEIPCDGIDNITEENWQYIQGVENSSGQYIIDKNKFSIHSLCKFTGKGNSAELQKTDNIDEATGPNEGDPFCLTDDGELLAWLEASSYFTRSINHFEYLLAFFEESNIEKKIDSDRKIEGKGIAFEINDNKYTSYPKDETVYGYNYYLSYNNSCNEKLYKVKLYWMSHTGTRYFHIEKTYDLKYRPKGKTSLLVFNNIIYYFSKDGFCFAKISGDNIENKLIDCVKVQDETSLLVSDKKENIYIINQTDGVIEYNTKSQTTKTIADFPFASLSTKTDFPKACFYSESNLYCITNKKVYTLDESSNPDDPNNPNNPGRTDQSGHTCGLLGLEFLFALVGLFIFRLCRNIHNA